MLAARTPRFDFQDVPLTWIPDDPYASHWLDVMHLAAPVFERGLLRVYRDALPVLPAGALKDELRGFMAQEASHAHAHDLVLAHMRAKGLETRPFVARCERVWQDLAGDRPPVPMPARTWLEWRLAVATAGEHLTTVLGDWIVAQQGLEARGADPTMLALLRWHGAEEVEHRAVAFDVLAAIAGPRAYGLRLAAMALVFPALARVQLDGVAYMLAHDPELQGRRFGWADHQRARERGLLAPDFPRALARFASPAFHPGQEGSLARAREVLAGLS